MVWFLLRTDQGGGYVADVRRNPTGGSYTRKVEYAKTYRTKEAAEADACSNERAVEKP